MTLAPGQKSQIIVCFKPVLKQTGVAHPISDDIYSPTGDGDLRISYIGGFAIIINNGNEIALPMDIIANIVSKS